MKKYYTPSKILLRILFSLLIIGTILLKQYVVISNILSALLCTLLLIVFSILDRRLTHQAK